MNLKEWAGKIKAHFEERFWIPETTEKSEFVDDALVQRRGVYKDTYMSSGGRTDYQFRPNVCIAMALAPDLFTPANATLCLSQISSVLLSPG